MIRSRNIIEGFTLLEMLVATTILVLMLVMAMGAINRASSLASQATQRIDANRVAREALDEIGRELSVASVPFNRFNTTTSVQLLIDPPSGTVLPAANPGSNPAFTPVANSDSIFWQAPLAHNRDYGNLSIVGYFVISDTSSSNSANWRLQLRRVYIEPETSGSIANPNYFLYSGSNSVTASGTTPWMTPALSGSYALPIASSTNSATVTDLSNGLEGWVADGVLAMWVRCLDKSGNPILTSATNSTVSNIYTYPQYNSSVAYSSTNSSTVDQYYYPAGSYTALPAYVDVAIACLAPSEMARIKSLPTVPQSDPVLFLSGTGIPGYLASFRKANPGVKSTEVFSRRFRIYNSD